MKRDLRLACMALLCLPSLAWGQKGSAPVDTIRPGITTRAEVDLAWGEPSARLGDQIFEYAAPPSLPGAQRVVVTYFSDTTQVSRVDIYLANPVSPETARADATLGARTLVRDRDRGEREELYAASFRGLILPSKDPDARIIGLSYLSARFLADLYAARFHECMKEKRYADARVEAEKTVAIDNDYARGYLMQGDYYASQGNDDEALVRYIAAAGAKYPPGLVAQSHLVLIQQYGLRKKWVEKAQAESQQALAGAVDSAQRVEAHVRWAEVLLDQKRDGDAFKELNAAVEANRNSCRARLAIGDYYYNRREYGEARPHYEIVIRVLDAGPVSEQTLEGRRTEVYFRYAYTLNDARDRGQAERYYRKVLNLDPRHPVTLNNLGSLLVDTGRIPEAVDLFRRAMEVKPNSLLVLNNWADALVRGGEYDEARGPAERALALKADDGRALAIMARAWAGQGKKKEALEWLGKSAAAGYHNRELASDPAFHKIRNDDAFVRVVEQMK